MITIGQKFDKLTVLSKNTERGHKQLYNCQCECGTKVERYSSTLQDKYFKSCGCHKPRYWIGQRFGKLIIMDGPTKDNSGFLSWLCTCECGVKLIVRQSRFREGKISCGCIRKDSIRLKIEGQKVGRLTIIKDRPDLRQKKWTPVYECQCDCGNITFVDSSALRRNETRSCGCLKRDYLKEQSHDSNNINYIKAKRTNVTWAMNIKLNNDCKCLKCNYDIYHGLTAHHKDSRLLKPELAEDINNGACICCNCHAILHTLYGRGKTTKEQFEEFINNDIEYLCNKYNKCFKANKNTPKRALKKYNKYLPALKPSGES